MRNKLFTFLLFIFFILGITIFIMPQKETSTFERRRLSTNSNIDINEFVNTTNKVMNDQFPFRDNLIKTTLNIMNLSNKVVASDTLLKIKDDIIHMLYGYHINDFYKLSKGEKETALNRAYNIQEISVKYPDIKIYVYFPTRIEETTLLDTDKIMSVFPQLRKEFIAQLGNNVKTDSLKVNSKEDYYKYFYKTDIHWNGYGAYEGYKDIVNMINKDFEIGDAKEAKFTTYPYDFYGNLALKIGFMCKPDNLIGFEVNTSDYKYFSNNIEKNDKTAIKHYEVKGNDNPLYSDYELAYGGNDYIRVYDFNQKDKPNLLIFGDSYVNSMMNALASHFNKTVIIDMRANDGTFNLDKIINDYNINAILFLQAFTDLYFNGYLFVPLD